ncbi:MAG TPA: PqqD family protein [Gemmatimonadaceae bacterium]|nr:PqqD family protein [Gemmatimonadaceae bacterium]
MPTRYRVDDNNVAWRIADDEAVLLHADSSGYFGLNRVGTLLWIRLAEHPMTLEQITAGAQGSFLAAPAGLPQEVSTFINQLLEFNLIEPDESGSVAARHTVQEATNGSALPWEPPTVERFGELEKLILSGE